MNLCALVFLFLYKSAFEYIEVNYGCMFSKVNISILQFVLYLYQENFLHFQTPQFPIHHNFCFIFLIALRSLLITRMSSVNRLSSHFYYFRNVVPTSNALFSLEALLLLYKDSHQLSRVAKRI